MSKILLASWPLGCVVVLAGCLQSDPQPTAAKPAAGLQEIAQHFYFHAEEKPHAAEWGYEADNGPAKWGELDPSYALAKTGKRQSPIDIPASRLEGTDLPELSFDYRPAKIDLVYNGHTIQNTEDAPNHLQADGKTYELKQFHFHAPSEHTIDGEHTAMEMHLVHKTKADRIAVVAVMIREGQENAAFKPLWKHLPNPSEKHVGGDPINAAALLPTERKYFRYDGSFTTPPCTEGVTWFVLKTPIELSTEQIATFKKIIQGNNRPVQLLNDRKILAEK